MTHAITISTHVLDTALGAPAADVGVTLEHVGESGAIEIVSQGRTNEDGRVPSLAGEATLAAGQYRIHFDVAGYFAATQRASFYNEISVSFTVGEAEHYHVPLLLSPFGYSTYRGS